MIIINNNQYVLFKNVKTNWSLFSKIAIAIGKDLMKYKRARHMN